VFADQLAAADLIGNLEACRRQIGKLFGNLFEGSEAVQVTGRDTENLPVLESSQHGEQRLVIGFLVHHAAKKLHDFPGTQRRGNPLFHEQAAEILRITAQNGNEKGRRTADGEEVGKAPHIPAYGNQNITGNRGRHAFQPVEGLVRGGREEGVRRDFAQKGGRKELFQQPQVGDGAGGVRITV